MSKKPLKKSKNKSVYVTPKGAVYTIYLSSILAGPSLRRIGLSETLPHHYIGRKPDGPPDPIG